MLTRLPSVSVNETYCPMPGICIGSKDFSTRIGDFLHRFFDNVYGYDYRWILSRPIGLFWKEAAVDSTGSLHHIVRVSICRGCCNVIAHLFAELVHPPAKSLRVKLHEPVTVFI